MFHLFSVVWQVSEAITFTIVQRENGLQQIKKIFEEGERDVKRTAISVIRNASRYQDLHPEIGNFPFKPKDACHFEYKPLITDP